MFNKILEIIFADIEKLSYFCFRNLNLVPKSA